MGGLPIQMPVVGRVSSRATPTDEPHIAAWFDDALPRISGYFLARVGGNIEIAKDLTQEAMLAAVRSRTAVDTVMPWLFGIARHKLIDHYRQVDKHGFSASDDLADLSDNTNTLPRLDLPVSQHSRYTTATSSGDIPIQAKPTMNSTE
jgi:RNA polymerase sigma-70 factor (ECF subfamily)